MEDDSPTLRGNNKNQNNALTALARKGSKYESTRSELTSPTIPGEFLHCVQSKKKLFFWVHIFFYFYDFFFIENLEVPSVTITSSASGTATTSTTPAGSATSSSTLQPSNHRRKKPKRRSTGVVNLDVDVS